MPCRVGITTDPNTRREQWRDQVVGFKNWRILSRFRNRAEAQKYEDRYARTYGCHAHPGGADAPGIWHVYRFDYTRERG
jgi:hypothetical protein